MAIKSGQKAVAAAGTPEPLGTDYIHAVLAILPLPANTGSVYIGNDGDDSVDASTGFVLAAGSTSPVVMALDDLDDVLVDAAVNGEGVMWYVVEPL